MSRPCPIYGVAISQDCVECETRDCRKMKKTKYKTIVVGIDQSYNNTGVTIAADGRLIKVSHIDFKGLKTNSQKRRKIAKTLNKVINGVSGKSENLVCIIERIRLKSQGFLNINYIKSIGALNATIVDQMHPSDIKVYSVDTRCWKAQVVGTSKPQNNKYGVPPEKWPTVKWVCSKGFKSSILRVVKGRKQKGTFEENGIKYEYDNDAADSAGIAMFWFVGDKEKLREEN